jgi:hypothetical protein
LTNADTALYIASVSYCSLVVPSSFFTDFLFQSDVFFKSCASLTTAEAASFVFVALIFCDDIVVVLLLLSVLEELLTGFFA